jgi:hypothetical protein
MTALLSTEALKLRTLRMSWVVAVLAVAVSAVSASPPCGSRSTRASR